MINIHQEDGALLIKKDAKFLIIQKENKLSQSLTKQEIMYLLIMQQLNTLVWIFVTSLKKKPFLKLVRKCLKKPHELIYSLIFRPEWNLVILRVLMAILIYLSKKAILNTRWQWQLIMMGSIKLLNGYRDKQLRIQFTQSLLKLLKNKLNKSHSKTKSLNTIKELLIQVMQIS